MANGFLLLPVLLSVLGPTTYFEDPHDHEDEIEEAEKALKAKNAKNGKKGSVKPFNASEANVETNKGGKTDVEMEVKTFSVKPNDGENPPEVKANDADNPTELKPNEVDNPPENKLL